MRGHRLPCMVVPFVSLAAVACQQQSTADHVAPSASASSVAAPLTASAAASATRPHRRFARHGGIASALFHGARDLDLTPAQQDSLDKIEASLKTPTTRAMPARRATTASASDGLGQHRTTRCTLRPLVAAVEPAEVAGAEE